MHVFVIKLKNYIIPTSFLLFIIFLLMFSTTNLASAKTGLTLWATSIVPSLFPFFVATELLSQTSIPHLLGCIFNVFMKPVFNIRGEGSFAFIMGLISGYPMGAKIACDFRKNNILSKVECERLLSFTNNSRSFVYCWNCWYKHVWQLYNWIFTFNYSYLSLSYSRFFV